jgi:hypothetical protein
VFHLSVSVQELTKYTYSVTGYEHACSGRKERRLNSRQKSAGITFLYSALPTTVRFSGGPLKPNKLLQDAAERRVVLLELANPAYFVNAYAQYCLGTKDRNLNRWNKTAGTNFSHQP